MVCSCWLRARSEQLKCGAWCASRWLLAHCWYFTYCWYFTGSELGPGCAGDAAGPLRSASVQSDFLGLPTAIESPGSAAGPPAWLLS